MKATLIFCFILNAFFSNAQIINTVTGNGSYAYTGDGGPATVATIGPPGYVFFDNYGSLYIEQLNNTIRKITPSDTIITIAGNGSTGFSGDGFPATAAEFNFTGGGGMAFDNANNLYIADQANNRIRKVDAMSGIVTTVIGTGMGGFGGDGGHADTAALNSPECVAFDTAGNLYILDGFNYRIRKVNIAGIISTIAGTGTMGFSGDGGPATAAEIYAAGGMRIGNSNCLYIADGIRIRKINLTNDTIITVAGDGIFGYGGDGGPADSAGFTNTEDVVQDAIGNLYISDRGNNRIRKVDTAGIITTAVGNGTGSFSGDGFPATAAEIYSPRGVAVDACGNLYFADNGNARIRKVTYPPILSNPVISLSSPAMAAVGTTVTVTAAVANAGSSYTIEWMNHNIEFTTTTVPSVTYSKPPGIDTITARIVPTGYGCWDSTTSAGLVVSLPSGVGSLSANEDLLIYPNPVSNILYIAMYGALVTQATISNVFGQVVEASPRPSFGKLTMTGEREVSLDVSHLPGGIYFVRVNGIYVQKFIKE